LDVRPSQASWPPQIDLSKSIDAWRSCPTSGVAAAVGRGDLVGRDFSLSFPDASRASSGRTVRCTVPACSGEIQVDADDRKWWSYFSIPLCIGIPMIPVPPRPLFCVTWSAVFPRTFTGPCSESSGAAAATAPSFLAHSSACVWSPTRQGGKIKMRVLPPRHKLPPAKPRVLAWPRLLHFHGFLSFATSDGVTLRCPRRRCRRKPSYKGNGGGSGRVPVPARSGSLVSSANRQSPIHHEKKMPPIAQTPQ